MTEPGEPRPLGSGRRSGSRPTPRSGSKAPPTAPSPDRRPAQAKGAAGLSNAQWIATIVAVSIVAIAAIVTLNSSGSGDNAATATTVPVTVSVTVKALPGELTGKVTIPAGEYTAFCKELNAETDAFAGRTSIESVRKVYSAVDFQKLIPLAPAGLASALQTLDARRKPVLDLLAQVQSIDDVSAADFPDGFLVALSVVGQTAVDRCAPLRDSGSN